jgi:hypothetical protein
MDNGYNQTSETFIVLVVLILLSLGVHKCKALEFIPHDVVVTTDDTTINAEGEVVEQ